MGEFLDASLKLVYPPISNREADWLYEIPEVRELVKRSKLYMIGKRPRLYFTAPHFNKRKMRLDFKLWQKKPGRRVSFSLYIKQFINERSPDVIDFYSGEKVIKIVESGREDEEPLVWFTPDKLLFDHWRGHLSNTGLGSIRDFTTFELLYVGISKEEDSFTRLFNQGHKNRTKILTQENQIEKGASLSEEIMLFFFYVIPQRIRTLDDSSDFERLAEPLPLPLHNHLIADAEKAFVHILESRYNKEPYKNYPHGSDGLFGEGLDRYQYRIEEDIHFWTNKTKFSGSSRDSVRPSIIMIEGETVTLIDS